MMQITRALLLAWLVAGCAAASESPRVAPGAGEPLAPAVAHHQHLLSPAVAALISPPVLPAVEVPADVAALLREHERAWNDAEALARLFADDAVVMDAQAARWVRGRSQAAAHMAGVFGRPYVITPVDYRARGDAAQLSGYYSRAVEGQPARPIGLVSLALVREGGVWRIAAESPSFPGPAGPSPIPADTLVAQMDAAGVRRAVVLSLGYTWASVTRPPVPDEYARVREENDWTAREAARFPDRLVAFCGVNPLRDYAVEEIGRCARELRAGGLKLHFGNSGVDVRNAQHVEKARAVFAAASRHRLPIVVHLWTRDPGYGAEHSRIFLDRILPAAPDVVVQVAHMAGAGPGYGPDAALEPLAAAVAADDARTRNLYFDVTSTVTTATSAAEADLVARRIRQIGPERILFGSDGAWGGNPPLRQAWGAFRATLPLTDAELRTIAANVAPYLR